MLTKYLSTVIYWVLSTIEKRLKYFTINTVVIAMFLKYQFGEKITHVAKHRKAIKITHYKTNNMINVNLRFIVLI